MLNSIVREALVTSVKCGTSSCGVLTEPRTSWSMSHESTVPKRTSPISARTWRLDIGRWWSIQQIFVAEKYGSTMRPVRDQMSSANPASLMALHISAVRWSCHTMAFDNGRPVARSQITVVSRWFVIPNDATSAAVRLASSSANRATPMADSAISTGSCSTHPERGNIWRSSC